jgi:endothelin-converting enzyme
LDEGHINEVGDKSLRHIVKVIRKLYREEDTDIRAKEFKREWDLGLNFNGLTAAVAYLHTRGAYGMMS